MIGVLASVLAVGWTAYGLNNADATEKRLDQSFTVKQELIANADTIASRTDGRTYRYVRLTQDEVPAGMKPGVYLVDESAGRAEYSRQDGVGGPRFHSRRPGGFGCRRPSESASENRQCGGAD